MEKQYQILESNNTEKKNMIFSINFLKNPTNIKRFFRHIS